MGNARYLSRLPWIRQEHELDPVLRGSFVSALPIPLPLVWSFLLRRNLPDTLRRVRRRNERVPEQRRLELGWKEPLHRDCCLEGTQTAVRRQTRGATGKWEWALLLGSEDACP